MRLGARNGKGLVVLFNPHVRVGKEQQRRTGIPLGLLAIATPLHLDGYEIRIVDQRTDPAWREHLGAALARSPICVGVTTKTGPQIRYALEATTLVTPEAAGEVLPWAHTIISNLKAWLLGTFRGVSHKHLDRYLKEFTYRLNRRWNEDKLFYYLTRRAVEGKPLPYHRLIAERIG